MATKSKQISKSERLEKVREKLKVTDIGGGGSQGFWSAPEGRSIIRILPEVGEMQFFFQTVGKHHFPGKKEQSESVYCPSFTSEGELECPVCELVDELYKGGDKQTATEIRVRKSYWMNIIVRGKKEDEKDSGPFIFTPGVMVFGEIANMVSDPDYGDVFDLNDGIDLIIQRTGTGLDTKYSVKPKRISTALSDDANQITEWISKARDLTYVVVDEDPEHDKKLGGDHALYLLPYNRIVAEYKLDADEIVEEEDVDDDADDEDVDDDDDVEELPARKPKVSVPAKREVEKRRMARRTSRN